MIDRGYSTKSGFQNTFEEAYDECEKTVINKVNNDPDDFTYYCDCVHRRIFKKNQKIKHQVTLKLSIVDLN